MTPCPFCGKPAVADFRHFTTDFARCAGCGLIIKAREKDHARILEEYRDAYFKEFGLKQLDVGRASVYRHVLTALSARSSPPGRLLDVGAGCGAFLAAARDAGWEVAGVDPSLDAITVARKRFGIAIRQGALADVPGEGMYDAVTFINVLDHCPRPWEELGHARRLLAPGGLLYLRCPNGALHSALARLGGLAMGIRRFLVFHEYALTPRWIRAMLAEAGFAGIEVSGSPLSSGDPDGLFRRRGVGYTVKQGISLLVRALSTLTAGRLVLAPSFDVFARKN